MSTLDMGRCEHMKRGYWTVHAAGLTNSFLDEGKKTAKKRLMENVTKNTYHAAASAEVRNRGGCPLLRTRIAKNTSTK